MFVEEHGVDDVREVETWLLLELLVVAAIGIGTLKTIASGCEEVEYNAFLNDVGDVVHIINAHIALVLRVDPIEFFKWMDGDGIADGILTTEATIGILDEDAAMDILLENCLVDGIGL